MTTTTSVPASTPSPKIARINAIDRTIGQKALEPLRRSGTRTLLIGGGVAFLALVLFVVSTPQGNHIPLIHTVMSMFCIITIAMTLFISRSKIVSGLTAWIMAACIYSMATASQNWAVGSINPFFCSAAWYSMFLPIGFYIAAVYRLCSSSAKFDRTVRSSTFCVLALYVVVKVFHHYFMPSVY